MGVFQTLFAIELIGSRKGTLLHLVENHLYIDKLALRHIDIYTGTKKFLCQYRNIEAVRVESCQIAAFNVTGHILCHLLESRAVRYIGVINAMYGRRSFRNMHFGIDTHCFRFLIPVRIYFQIANFNDPVCVDIGSRCLQIEEHNRVFQI